MTGASEICVANLPPPEIQQPLLLSPACNERPLFLSRGYLCDYYVMATESNVTSILVHRLFTLSRNNWDLKYLPL